MPVQRARIVIGGEEACKEVAADEEAISFTLSLPAGGTHLQTWFELEDGKDLGAYFVYIEQMIQ